MKKIIIFFMCLYIFTCCIYSPSNVQVGTGFTERFIVNLEDYSDAAGNSFTHLDLITDIKIEIVYLQERFQSVPGRLTSPDEPSLLGIYYLLETFAMCVVDVLSLPLYLVGFLFVFIVDTINLILNTVDLLDVFQHTL